MHLSLHPYAWQRRERRKKSRPLLRIDIVMSSLPFPSIYWTPSPFPAFSSATTPPGRLLQFHFCHFLFGEDAWMGDKDLLRDPVQLSSSHLSHRHQPQPPSMTPLGHLHDPHDADTTWSTLQHPPFSPSLAMDSFDGQLWPDLFCISGCTKGPSCPSSLHCARSWGSPGSTTVSPLIDMPVVTTSGYADSFPEHRCTYRSPQALDRCSTVPGP
jgi:hypothetical protein